MDAEKAIQAIAHIVEEKKKLEIELTKLIKEFEEKYGVTIAFLRNKMYIKMNGEERTEYVQLDIKV
jgi:hypothetical protein